MYVAHRRFGMSKLILQSRCVHDTHPYSRPFRTLLCKVGSVDDGQKAQTGTKILFMSFHKYCGPGLVATAFQYVLHLTPPCRRKIQNFDRSVTAENFLRAMKLPATQGGGLISSESAVNLIWWGQDCTVQATLRQLCPQNVQRPKLQLLLSKLCRVCL